MSRYGGKVPVKILVPKAELERVDEILKSGLYGSRAEFFLTGGRFLLRDEHGNNQNSVGVET